MAWDEAIGFVAVADGMGGHQAGEVASSTALDAVLSFMRRSASSDDFTWPFGVNPKVSLTANRLITALQIANRRVFKRSEEVRDYVGMGTTLVALVVEGSRVTLSSVGDSRCYLLTEGRLQQLTRDDSWLTMLADGPDFTPEKLKNHPLRNVLTKVVGAKPELEVTAQEVTLTDETLLLCSDGLHGALPAEVMAKILTDERDLDRGVDALVKAALERDGKDNITAVLVRA